MNSETVAALLGLPELPRYIKEIERILVRTVETHNPHMQEPTLRMVKSGGKRLRPILMMAAAASQGGKISDEILEACAAVELIHVGTIVHDDIIDDGDVRWGVPTVNKREGASNAILVGDYVLAKATALAASVSREAGQITAETIAVMCEGQSQETADNFNVQRSIESYNDTIYKKTAALISTACRIGALSAKLPKSQVDALATFGVSFGMAYQLIDDLLDLTSTPAVMGKPTANDIKEGVYTFPVLLAFQSPKHKDLERLILASDKNANHPKIVELLSESSAFDMTLKETKKHITSAENSLATFQKNKTVDGLIKLPSSYYQWAIQKQSVCSSE